MSTAHTPQSTLRAKPGTDRKGRIETPISTPRTRRMRRRPGAGRHRNPVYLSSVVAKRNPLPPELPLTYSVPMNRTAQASDRVRQILVFLLSIAAIAAAFIGSGALGGTPIQEAAGGALAADSTLIAPASPAFSIWSVIYVGLFAYAVWQLFPSQAARTVHRRVGYLVALTMLLNAAWIGSVQLGQLGLSVVVIVILLAILGITFSKLQGLRGDTESASGGVLASIILDGTIGLYLGWVTIATAANVTAWLTKIGFRGFDIDPEVWGVAVVVVAALVGIATTLASEGRLTPALALAWGLSWLAVARLTDEPSSQIVGIAAAIAAGAVVTVAIIRRAVFIVRGSMKQER